VISSGFFLSKNCKLPGFLLHNSPLSENQGRFFAKMYPPIPVFPFLKQILPAAKMKTDKAIMNGWEAGIYLPENKIRKIVQIKNPAK
jgi:hypothetical protein